MQLKILLFTVINRKALKGLANGIILANLSHLTGHLVFITYAALILDRVGATHIDPSISSISLAVLQLIGSICTARFSDTLGRKTLLIISFVGSAMGMISFTIYSYLKHNGHELSAFEWVPIASLSIVIFAASTGAVPLVSVCIVENIPSKVRSYRFSNFILRSMNYCMKLPFLDPNFGSDDLRYLYEHSVILLSDAVSDIECIIPTSWMHFVLRCCMYLGNNLHNFFA